MVTVGRMRPLQEVKPEAGSTGSSTAKTVSSITPVQKSGMDCPVMVRTLAPSSRGVSACRAIHTPSGTATATVTAIAATESVIV